MSAKMILNALEMRKNIKSNFQIWTFHLIKIKILINLK
jgi:hypothetical protein